MPNVSYPDVLPLPLKKGYSIRTLPKFLTTSVQLGPPISILLTDSSSSAVSFTLKYTLFEWRLFEGWFKHEIVSGSKPFDMLILVGNCLVVHECMFDSKSAFTESVSDDVVTIQVSGLIVIDRKVDDLETYNCISIISKIACRGKTKEVIKLFNHLCNDVMPTNLGDIVWGVDKYGNMQGQ